MRQLREKLNVLDGIDIEQKLKDIINFLNEGKNDKAVGDFFKEYLASAKERFPTIMDELINLSENNGL